MVSQQIVDSVDRALRKMGLAVVLLGLVAFSFWRLTAWAAPHADALVKAHLDFVSSTTLTIERQQALMEKQSDMLQQQGRVVDAIYGLSKGLADGDQRKHWDARFDQLLQEFETIKRRNADRAAHDN